MSTRWLTGIKPTGLPHLGNLVGAMKPAFELLKADEKQEGLFFIADYHALIDERCGDVLRSQVLEVAAAWLACGLDLSRAHLYLQSDIPEILELQWILSCLTPKGVMNRSHAYKARVQENAQAQRDEDRGVSMGLYSYPVLMAADILIAQAHGVPVGSDQRQHVEVARDLAERFHHAYSYSVFTLPQAYVLQGEGRVLPGIDGRKMSKSYGNHIPLFLSSPQLRKKIMKIATDSSGPQEPKEPRGTLFELYRAFATEQETAAIIEAYRGGISWGDVKQALYVLIDRELAPAREAYKDLMAHEQRIHEVLDEGAQALRSVAQNTLSEVKKVVGTLRQP